MHHTKQKEHIKTILEKTFDPVFIQVRDESHLHTGHAGAKLSGGHFVIEIVSDKFNGKTLIQRHRMINDCLKNHYGTMIHALSVKARSARTE